MSYFNQTLDFMIYEFDTYGKICNLVYFINTKVIENKNKKINIIEYYYKFETQFSKYPFEILLSEYIRIIFPQYNLK